MILMPEWLASPWCVAGRVIAGERARRSSLQKTKPVPACSVAPSLQEVDLTGKGDAVLEKLRSDERGER